MNIQPLLMAERGFKYKSLCALSGLWSGLASEQSDWLADIDEEIDEQELEAHYSYMAKIQEVPNADSGTDSKPLEQVQYDIGYNVFANEIQHSEQSESISNTCVVKTGDSNVILDSPDMCDNDIQNDQNAVECDDERVALANLIANLKLDVDENKKIQKQLKKENASLTQELTECKSVLAETSRTLEESNSIRDSCLVALQNKQTGLEKYIAFNDRTVDYEKLEHKLNETLGLLAQKDIDIKEGLKLKAYKILVVQEKHDKLVKQSLLTKSHYEGLVKEKTKVITDLKLKEEKDIDKMISMENQLKFLNEIVYKRSQSIQTIHMLAPKCPTFNGRPTFANPMYLKKVQYEIPCLYEIPHDQSDPANRLVPDREETLTLEKESRSKLNKDLVKPYDYTKLNSLYEIFKPPTQEYLVELAHANEVRNKMWRKYFVKTKPNIFKNIDFLHVSRSISKSRQAYNVMTNNINHLRELVDQAWVKHSNDHINHHAPTAQDMQILIKTCLTPLSLKTQHDSFIFVHELKKEMHADLKYVESLEKEIDELESDKAEFSNMTVNDDTYDDPFDFKEEKIKRVFLSGAYSIHETSLISTNCATPDKNVKKTTNASLILEDFNPLSFSFMNFLSIMEVLGTGALLLFSSKNEEKVYNPGILTSKRVHTCLLPELSHRGTKAFKVTKILESPMEIFPCSYQENIRVLDVPCLHISIPFDTSSSKGGLGQANDLKNKRFRGGTPCLS
ncbi:hypothetical protein Tco_1353568 [Tanacetum coccineum]